MSHRRPKILAAAITAMAATLAVAAFPANAAEPDPETPYGYDASAGGTLVRVLGGTVASDLTSASTINGTTYPAGNSNSLASADVGTLLKVGAISTSTSATKTGTNHVVTSKAETAGVSLLNGIIKVNAVTTETTAKRTGTVLSGDSQSELLGVSIKGKKIPLKVDNNFGVNLPGIASVILNEKKVDIVGGKVTVTGSALKVTLLKKYEGSPVGTTIALNPTTATLTPSGPTSDIKVGGYAYGSYASLNVGSSVKVISGPTAAIGTPPGGTFGYDIQNRTAAVNVPLVLKAGVVQSTANATTSATAADVTHSNEVAGINVLNGLIKADAVKVTARSQKGPEGRTQTPSAEIVGLVIGGKKIAVNTAPNTTITLPGVLKVVVNEQTVNALGNQVAGLHITLLAPKSGLKTGADIYVAVAGSIVY